LSWQDYIAAPEHGTAICADTEIGDMRSVTVTTRKGSFPILLVRASGEVRAFVNACPHQFLPLDHRGPQILSADGDRLICSAHGAIFDAGTGAGLAGPGEGCALDRVPIHRQGEMLHIGEASVSAG
jgi:nitrite reductase/ring-hydroxylating ferredoxin subunit